MLRLLLDEHISPIVAKQLASRRKNMAIVGLPQWEDGLYLGARDDALLAAACEQNLTLLTYDCRTIVPLLQDWGKKGVAHGGAVLADERTIAQNDYGGLVRAVEILWDAQQDFDWTNRVVYPTK